MSGIAARVAAAEGGAEIEVAGARLLATPAGALVWPAERLVVVADLHLEKGSAFATRGVFLPPYDTAATLRRLKTLLECHDPRTILFLGDTFHDRRAEARLCAADRENLAGLLAAREAIFIAGNHDPEAPVLPGVRAASELAIGPLVFRHEPVEGAALGEIAGHLHPVARVATRGRAVRRRCFVGDGTRLVLPALGAYAGGLDVRTPAFRPLFPRGFTVHLTGEERLFAFPSSHCLPV